jgi:hypothetical protein
MHNNIKPCWWGSQLWQTIYFIVATYPENPNSEEIESIKCFFRSLKVLLPCVGCQESYSKFSCESNTNIDNIDNFKSKDNLIKFVFDLRNKVNGKLTHNYNINLNYFKKKISYMVINDNNNYDGRVCEMVEAPFVSPDLEKKIFIYLKLCTKNDYNFTRKILDISKKFMENPVFDYNNKIFKLMYKRHKKCRKIMCKIYHRMSEGKYDIAQSFLVHDTELHDSLLHYGCSILHRENLATILDSKISKKSKN